MLCALCCAGKMISNFCRIIETNRISLVVTLALIAKLLQRFDFPVCLLLLLVVVVCAFTQGNQTWDRGYLLYLFLFWKLRRVFALRSWHHVTALCSCCGTNDVYCRDSGDLPPGWQQDKGSECSVSFSAPVASLLRPEQYLLCVGHMSQYTRGFVFQGIKHGV